MLQFHATIITFYMNISAWFYVELCTDLITRHTIENTLSAVFFFYDTPVKIRFSSSSH